MLQLLIQHIDKKEIYNCLKYMVNHHQPLIVEQLLKQDFSIKMIKSLHGHDAETNKLLRNYLATH